MSLRDIVDRLTSTRTRGDFEGSWRILYPQLLAACQQTIAHKDTACVDDCLTRLKSSVVPPGIAAYQGEWIQTCLRVWLHCTQLALLVGGGDMAALLQHAWEAIRAAQRLYQPTVEAPGPLPQEVPQRLDHWPTLLVDPVDIVLTAFTPVAPPVSYARDVARYLLDQAHAGSSSRQITVLFTQKDGTGVVGRLVLETLPQGQGDLFPHPCQMSSVLEKTFTKAMRCAQSCIQAQGLWPPHTDVRWWVAQWHEYTPWPTFELSRDSLGGAFAVGLGCLFQQRPVDVLCAITAAVTSSGALCGIGELPAKLRAASQAGITQVIVARNQDFTGVDPAYWSWQVPETGVVVVHRR